MKIKTIVLEIEDKEIELTLDKVVELKNLLNGIVGQIDKCTDKTSITLIPPINYQIDSFRFWEFKVGDSPEQYKIMCRS